MATVHASERPAAGAAGQRPLTTEDAGGLAARHRRRSRRIQGIAILGGVPVVLALWVLLSRARGLDVIFTARAAMLSAIPFVLIGFLISLFFNCVWQVPPVVLPSLFTGLAHTPGRHLRPAAAARSAGRALAWLHRTLPDGHLGSGAREAVRLIAG